MPKRGKTYRGKSRSRKQKSCGCFYCTGGDKRYELHHLQLEKNKNWLEDEESDNKDENENTD